MAPSKLRFQLYDSDGNRLTISLEGNVSRDKVLQILDLFEMMGGLSKNHPLERFEGQQPDTTKLERIKGIIKGHFPIGWFSSKEIQLTYEDVFKEPIALSTVSTYLQRLSETGFLMKAGSRAERRYKMAKFSQMMKNV
ncbi:hypothetical protein KEJ36_01640 [Candidatus Bathyarchaeota archaeon]|nr:hypothetical protein [Candidatus Bathyarchaeota archaeon]MBS7627518.1 hypothetical protein [Candidatus Bathyarchaeota archaeon]